MRMESLSAKNWAKSSVLQSLSSRRPLCSPPGFHALPQLLRVSPAVCNLGALDYDGNQDHVALRLRLTFHVIPGWTVLSKVC